MIRLTVEQIEKLHDSVINKTGGSLGIRDKGLVESAVNTPFQTFGGQDLYPSLEEKAVRLGYGLTMNHGFIDGNKRIGALALLTLLEINGKELKCTDQELEDVFLVLGAGEMSDTDLLDWVKSHL